MSESTEQRDTVTAHAYDNAISIIEEVVAGAAPGAIRWEEVVDELDHRLTTTVESTEFPDDDGETMRQVIRNLSLQAFVTGFLSAMGSDVIVPIAEDDAANIAIRLLRHGQIRIVLDVPDEVEEQQN